MLLGLSFDFVKQVVALNLFIDGLTPQSSIFNCETILNLGFAFQQHPLK